VEKVFRDKSDLTAIHMLDLSKKGFFEGALPQKR